VSSVVEKMSEGLKNNLEWWLNLTSRMMMKMMHDDCGGLRLMND